MFAPLNVNPRSQPVIMRVRIASAALLSMGSIMIGTTLLVSAAGPEEIENVHIQNVATNIARDIKVNANELPHSHPHSSATRCSNRGRLSPASSKDGPMSTIGTTTTDLCAHDSKPEVDQVEHQRIFFVAKFPIRKTSPEQGQKMIWNQSSVLGLAAIRKTAVKRILSR